MLDKPKITKTTERPTAMIHLKVPRAEIMNVMGPGLNEVRSAVAAQGIEEAGPWLTHHLRMDPEVFDFEICVPVKSPIRKSGRVEPGRLPAGRVARTVYRGPYEGLGAAWGELKDWITAKGLKQAQDLWEVYAAGPEAGPDPAAWRTELNQPLLD